ncbi:cell division protein FtsQ [Haemophilus paracuniculus]|uniref:Cell division protein FtsQ n=1 Tax=Haemophilus paracuniculus TaxID=734 RepID=A0A1T0ARQ5_9PAST|nr:cell division protein FtsQ/DivIB [Haemophilus paracuniculus]OOR98446.1 cell division protein FtsQ [Haemophilus paracuniculus]
MFGFLRPKVSAKVKKPKGVRDEAYEAITNFISPSRKTVVKFLAIVISGLLLSGLYYNWQTIAEKLDSGAIRSYALTNKPRFTTNADLREALSAEPALKGYFSQNIKEIEDKLLAMPWVKNVVVRKIWPDRLSISLSEHYPVAIWNKDKFLSAQGDVFSLPAGRFNAFKLPIMFGPDEKSKDALAAWEKIGTELKNRGLELVALTIDERDSWQITLANDIKLRLGKGNWVDKIDRFMLVYPAIEIPQGQRLDYVDLRYKHGVAVGFRSE